MANGELTYDDFLQRLDIQDILMDAGYHLNKRDGLRYPSYIRTDSNGASVVTSSSSRRTANAVSSHHSKSSIISYPLSRHSLRNLRNTGTASLPTGWSTLSATGC